MEDLIKKYSARIQYYNQVGTGVIFGSDSDADEKINILTAKHIFKNDKDDEFEVVEPKTENLKIKYMDSIVNLDNVDFYVSKQNDFVIIQVDKQAVIPELESYKWKKLTTSEKKEKIYLGMGYPNRKDYSIKIASKFRNYKNDGKLVFYNESTAYNPEHANSMVGYSGTGLFAKDNGNDGEPVLVGIITDTERKDLHGDYEALSIEKIADELQNVLGWKLPEEYVPMPPKTYGDTGIKNIIATDIDVLDGDTKKAIALKYKTEFETRETLSGNERYINIPKCEDCRALCNNYWCGKIWKNIFEEALAGTDIKVEYVCSEGADDNKARIADIINGLLTSTDNSFSEDSIIIWQSSKEPDISYTNKRKVERIIVDFANKNPLELKKGYDLITGECSIKYAVIHKNHLLTILANSVDFDEAKKMIREAVKNDIWK